jgi:hypothetical protein
MYKMYKINSLNSLKHALPGKDGVATRQRERELILHALSCAILMMR